MMFETVKSTTRDFSSGAMALGSLLLAVEVTAHDVAPGTDVSTMQSIGMLAQELIDPILGFVATEHVAPALALIIFFVGMLCTAQVVHINYRDTQVITQMGRLFPESEREFAGKYPDFEEQMLKLPSMTRAWTEFCETLVLPVDKSANPIFRNTVRPHVFFNLDRLELGVEDKKSWPSVFVGVGLFFTFLGLIAALDAAVDVVSSANAAVENVANEESLKRLFGAMSAMFVSLLLTVAITHAEKSINMKLGRLNDKIERGVHFSTQEGLAQQSLVVMEQQLEYLRRLTAEDKP
jgi:hypothetical protein